MGWSDFTGWINDNVIDPISDAANDIGETLSNAGASINTGVIEPIKSTVATIYSDAKEGAGEVVDVGKEAASFYGDQIDKITDIPKQIIDTGKDIVEKTEETLFSPFTMLAIGGVALVALILLK